MTTDAQFIDIGASSKQEAEELIRIGDPVTFAESFARLHGDRVTSRGFDDKVGSFVVAEVLRHIAATAERLPVDLYGVSSVQEEIGLRGGTTCAYTINPDVGICVEMDSSTDQPDLDKKNAGDIRLGKGPVLLRGANINSSLFDLLDASAELAGIPVQYSGLPSATKTDANVMQISRYGMATAIVKIPLRYMHSPVEVISLSDVDHAINLLVKTLSEIRDNYVFIPT
jgi:endoglucanase